MKIKELYIAEFGCLKDCRILPTEGLNLIGGANGSGKSTVLLFIKFMLYGLPRRKAGDDGEHDRSVSWQGHRAAGRMLIETAKGSFWLEREHMETGGRKRGSDCTVTDCADGSRLSIPSEPGEYFLGVPREVFESSAAIGQMKCARIDGEKTASVLGNLLLAADESVDVAKIRRRMEDVRTEYQHKNRQGGRLVRQSMELAELRSQIERETKNTLRLGELAEQHAADLSLRDAVKAELEAARAVRDQCHDATVLCRFERFHQAEQAYGEVTREWDELERSSLQTDFRPTEVHVGALRAAADAHRDAEDAVAEAKEAAAAAERGSVDQDLVRMGESLRAAGGSEAVLGALRDREKKAKTKQKRGFAFLCVAVLWGVAALLLGLAELPMNIFWIGIGGSALLAVLSVLFGVLSLVGGRKEKQTLCEMLTQYGRPLSELFTYFAACEQELARAKQNQSEAENARIHLGFAESQARRTGENLTALLQKTLTALPSSLAVGAVAEADRLADFLARYGMLTQKADTLAGLLASERSALAEYDEAALAARVTVDIHSITPRSLEEADRKCRFESEKLRMLEEKLERSERERILLSGSAKDTVALRDRLQELNEQNRADRDYFDALELAIASMEEAEEAMRGNVTPELTRRAGEWMRQVSGGRYETVKTTKELRLSTEEDGYPVPTELLSGGTREMAYLALRLALVKQIYREEMPPILMDEPLCQLDDLHAERTLSLLGNLAEEGDQILLFTCHGREAELCEKLSLSAAEHRMNG